MDRRHQSYVLRVIGLGLVAAGLYLPSLAYGLVYEDLNSPAAIYQPSSSSATWRYAPRAVLRASFRWTTAAFGRSPVAAHAVNLALHLLNGILLAVLLWPWAGQPWALWALGYFWLWPLPSEAVIYLSGGRGELLVTTGLLLAIIGLLRPATVHGALLVVLGAALALASKEAAVATLPLLALVAWRFAVPVRRLVTVLLGVASTGLVYALRFTLRNTVQHTWQGWPLHFGQQIGAWWRLSLFFVWPAGLSVDHDFGSMSAAVALVAFGGLVAALLVAWSMRTRQPAFCFMFGWVLVYALPRLLLPSTEFLTEAHFYVPTAGVAIGLATAHGRS